MSSDRLPHHRHLRIYAAVSVKRSKPTNDRIVRAKSSKAHHAAWSRRSETSRQPPPICNPLTQNVENIPAQREIAKESQKNSIAGWCDSTQIDLMILATASLELIRDRLSWQHSNGLSPRGDSLMWSGVGPTANDHRWIPTRPRRLVIAVRAYRGFRVRSTPPKTPKRWCWPTSFELAQPQIRGLVITAPGAYAASSSVEIRCDT